MAENNTARFTDPSSFCDGPPLIEWPEGLPFPADDDPFYEGILAAVYGHQLNGFYWQLDENNIPIPVIS